MRGWKGKRTGKGKKRSWVSARRASSRGSSCSRLAGNGRGQRRATPRGRPLVAPHLADCLEEKTQACRRRHNRSEIVPSLFRISYNFAFSDSVQLPKCDCFAIIDADCFLLERYMNRGDIVAESETGESAVSKQDEAICAVSRASRLGSSYINRGVPSEMRGRPSAFP